MFHENLNLFLKVFLILCKLHCSEKSNVALYARKTLSSCQHGAKNQMSQNGRNFEKKLHSAENVLMWLPFGFPLL